MVIIVDNHCPKTKKEARHQKSVLYLIVAAFFLSNNVRTGYSVVRVGCCSSPTVTHYMHAWFDARYDRLYT